MCWWIGKNSETIIKKAYRNNNYYKKRNEIINLDNEVVIFENSMDDHSKDSKKIPHIPISIIFH
jgi:hypothetical protein